MWFLGNSVAFLNAPYFSTIMACSIEVEEWAVKFGYPGFWVGSGTLWKENHHTELQTYQTDHAATTESSLNHNYSREAFSSPENFQCRKHFLGMAVRQRFILAALRIGSCQVQSIDPGLVASDSARTKKNDAADLFLSIFCVFVFVLDLFFWSVRSFVVCLGLYCFRFYFCMFGFYGEYFCRSFFSFLPRPGRGTRALGFPGRFGSADRSPGQKAERVDSLRRSVPPWKQTKTTLETTFIYLHIFVFVLWLLFAFCM